MANVIVVAVVIVLLGFALKGTLKHLKGESPCCGGGDTIIIEDKKLDGPVIYLTNPAAACYTYFIVKGMQSIRKGKSNDIG